MADAADSTPVALAAVVAWVPPPSPLTSSHRHVAHLQPDCPWARLARNQPEGHHITAAVQGRRGIRVQLEALGWRSLCARCAGGEPGAAGRSASGAAARSAASP